MAATATGRWYQWPVFRPRTSSTRMPLPSWLIRSSLGSDQMSSQDLVRAYKLLANVERAFRSLKSIELQVRPVYHRLEDRVRAHVFLCMLAYYVRWHLERAWAPLLFRDEHKPWPEDPVAPARRSVEAEQKARSQRRPEGEPVHSFSTSSTTWAP
jgi:hypothetical protein